MRPEVQPQEIASHECAVADIDPGWHLRHELFHDFLDLWIVGVQADDPWQTVVGSGVRHWCVVLQERSIVIALVQGVFLCFFTSYYCYYRKSTHSQIDIGRPTMPPKQPTREGQLGFLYLPPYRVQGVSVAGEQTAIGIPELDIVFDIGLCPRPVLSAGIVALSHTHMDHVAGLPYYFSQRFFQKLPTGKCYCPAQMAEPLRAMMRAWIDLERQETPHEIIGMNPGDVAEVKPNLFLRAHQSSHTIPSLGYALFERRNKLRDEYVSLPQDRIRDLRLAGTEVTRSIDIPIVAYTGDTEPAPFLFHQDFVDARIVIVECTFFDGEHRDRAKIGKHIHVEDLRPLIAKWKAQDVVVVHASRRTMLSYARLRLDEVAGERAPSVHMLMDFRTNRLRLERQAADEQAVEPSDLATSETTEQD